MNEYVIVRILAGELPPRDAPGGRLAALRFVLDHEPPLPAARKVFLLNAVHDRTQRAARIDLLESRGVAWEELLFDPSAWRRAANRRQRLCVALGINRARNRALLLGGANRAAGQVRFTLPLDGECYFTRAAWQRFRRDVAADQRVFPQRRYYSLPMYRVRCDLRAIASMDVATATPEEPQLAFRHDAPRRFDPTRPWGQQNKLALLTALGHRQGSGQMEFWPRKRHCASAGWVYHLATHPVDENHHLQQRALLRERAARALLERLNAMYSANEEEQPDN